MGEVLLMKKSKSKPDAINELNESDSALDAWCMTRTGEFCPDAMRPPFIQKALDDLPEETKGQIENKTFLIRQ